MSGSKITHQMDGRMKSKMVVQKNKLSKERTKGGLNGRHKINSPKEWKFK